MSDLARSTPDQDPEVRGPRKKHYGAAFKDGPKNGEAPVRQQDGLTLYDLRKAYAKLWVSTKPAAGRATAIAMPASVTVSCAYANDLTLCPGS